MITFTRPAVTIKFFSHRNPRVTVDNVIHDVWRVRVLAKDPVNNQRHWYCVNFHDHLALQAAINAADVLRLSPYQMDLMLSLRNRVTFMEVPHVYVISFQYMGGPRDTTPLETPRIVSPVALAIQTVRHFAWGGLVEGFLLLPLPLPPRKSGERTAAE